jgi:hypothetical protein
MDNDDSPSVTLTHPESTEIVLKFDPLDRELSWMKHLLFLPWTTPSRMIGFIHPDAEKDINVKPFMLFGTFSYIGSVGFDKPDASGQTRVLQGPKLVLPYDMITPLDIHVGAQCPSWIFVREQAEPFQKLMAALLMQIIAPPKVKVATPQLVIPG